MILKQEFYLASLLNLELLNMTTLQRMELIGGHIGPSTLSTWIVHKTQGFLH